MRGRTIAEVSATKIGPSQNSITSLRSIDIFYRRSASNSITNIMSTPNESFSFAATKSW
jgi:hypothetical protein